MIADNISTVRQTIEAACVRAGRDPKSVRLLAVSKTKSAEEVSEAILAGQHSFAENYVQEAAKKVSQLQLLGPLPEFHYIGALQRNKANDAVRLFTLIHSVDREALAEAISQAAVKIGKTQPVLAQVNVSGEQSKSGIAPEDALNLCRKIESLPGLLLSGLMCIGEYGLVEALRRKEFQLLRELRGEFAEKLGNPLPELSMGMSEDYAWAVEEGATIVRVGTAIFGVRQQEK